MTFGNLSIYIKSLFGYLLIGIFFPLFWLQGIFLRRIVLRLPTPTDDPYGCFEGKKNKFKILGLGESPMAGVGISKYSETLTGLTSNRLNKLMDIHVNWRIIAQNGLTIKKLNQLIREESPLDIDLIIVSIGGNDVFNLTPPWVWERNLDSFVNYFVRGEKTPIIIFSPVPCVGRFPAIPNPLRLAFGYWESILQKSLTIIMNSKRDVYLLKDRFPDGKKYFLNDGIHPSKLAYKLWSERLASKAIEMMQRQKYNL